MILDKGSVKTGNLAQATQFDEEMKEEREDMTDQKPSDQLIEGGDQLNVTSSSNPKGEEKTKNIDRRQFVQYLLNFPTDQGDIEKLSECLEYIKSQQNDRRKEIMDLEKLLLKERKLLRDADPENIHVNLKPPGEGQ